MSGKYSEKFHKNMSVHLSRFRDVQIGYVVAVGKWRSLQDAVLQFAEGHQGCQHQGAALEVLRGHGRLPRTNKVLFQLKSNNNNTNNNNFLRL